MRGSQSVPVGSLAGDPEDAYRDDLFMANGENDGENEGDDHDDPASCLWGGQLRVAAGLRGIRELLVEMRGTNPDTWEPETPSSNLRVGNPSPCRPLAAACAVASFRLLHRLAWLPAMFLLDRVNASTLVWLVLTCETQWESKSGWNRASSFGS